MQSIRALSQTFAVKNWLANSHHPRILHIFDDACNLINEQREMLSIVTPEIGMGPFNLVLESNVLFSDSIRLESPVSISPDQLRLGDLAICTANIQLWDPRPDWRKLHNQKETILLRLRQLPIIAKHPFEANYPTPILQLSNSLLSSLAIADLPSSVIVAKQLAGLGIGLTPSGDDFIMGALYSTWIIHPHEFACVLAEEIANTAAPLTTSLSAAYLKSAGKGGAGILWHNFFDALISYDLSAIQVSMENLQAVGHTSGTDALAGFIGTFMSYAESSEAEPCLS